MDFKNIQYGLAVVLLLVYGILMILERTYTLRTPTRPFLPRAALNIGLSLIVYSAAALFISPFAHYTLTMNQTHSFGLLNVFKIQGALHLILGFLLMDLTFYYWHRLNHEIPLLWRFHNVHHIDPDLDVTTSMRFHVVEIAYSSIFRILQLGLIGVNPLAFIAYETAFQLNTFFQHSNVKVPIAIERIINKVLVTPRMHGIHHSNIQDETNRNYGVVFSFWDRLHNTLTLNRAQQSLIIGVPGYSSPSDNRFLNVLLLPFKAQKAYWHVGSHTFYTRKSHSQPSDIRYLME